MKVRQKVQDVHSQEIARSAVGHCVQARRAALLITTMNWHQHRGLTPMTPSSRLSAEDQDPLLGLRLSLTHRR